MKGASGRVILPKKKMTRPKSRNHRTSFGDPRGRVNFGRLIFKKMRGGFFKKLGKMLGRLIPEISFS
jgi:hypothetical protein